MNIRDVLRELKIPYSEHGESGLVSAGWVGIECGRCGAGTGKRGLGIHTGSLATSCWKCGKANLISALSLISGQSYGAIKALLGDVIPERAAEVIRPSKIELPPGVGDFLPAHRQYLRGRGLDPDEVSRVWGLRGIGPNCGVYSWRIYVPILDSRGVLASWTTRAIGDVEHGKRYRAAKDSQALVPRGELLFGEHFVRHAVVITEGQFDAIWGGPGFVATAGVGFSSAQVLRLSKYPVRCVLFDRDAAAQRRAHDLARELGCFPGDTVILQTSGEDPASSPVEERDEIRLCYLT